MRKSIKTAIGILLATSCTATALAFVGCDNGNKPTEEPCTQHVDVDGNGKCDNCGTDMPQTKPEECTQHVDTDGNGKCDKCGADMPQTPPEKDTYTLSITGDTVRDIDIDSTGNLLKYTVLKNGAAVTTEKVKVTVSGDSVTFDEQTGAITPAKIGRTVIKLTLEDHDDVAPAQVTFNVHEWFYSHEASLQRGDLNFSYEDSTVDPYVGVLGGQASLLVKQASTKFVYKCKVTIGNNTAIPQNSSFGVASFLPIGEAAGDNALWFGLRNNSVNTATTTFAQYTRSFYEGWTAIEHEGTDAGYGSLDTGRNEIELVIIRDGADYYYSIDGCYGKYTAETNEDVATYAGVYSQNIALEVSDYTYSSDDADIATAIDEYYTNRTVAVVAINESYITDAVKGESVTFTAAAYPTDKAAGAELEWSLDKQEMTAGADGSSVENGVLTLADDAAGYVTLTCKVKGTDISSSVRLEILQQSRYEETDKIKAWGGVSLSADGGISFPTQFSHKNGISDTTDIGSGLDMYSRTAYCATLKDTVTKDFTLSFTFSEYVTNITTPKVQVAIGTEGMRNNNFYLVYNNSGQFRIEAFVYGTKAGVVHNGAAAGWYNTDWVGNFDPNAEHSVEISVASNGIYVVKLDGQTLQFKWNEQTAEPSTIVRQSSTGAFESASNVKFATQNCSVKIGNIQVTNGTCEVPDFMSDNKVHEISQDGKTLTLHAPGYGSKEDGTGDGWIYREWDNYRAQYTKPIDGNAVIEFDVAFSDVFRDGKLGFLLGKSEFNFNNNQGLMTVDFVRKENGELKMTSGGSIATNGLDFHVRYERNNNVGRLIVNGKQMFDNLAVDSEASLDFYIFTMGAVNINKSITVSGLTVSAYSKQDVYELNTTNPDVRMKAGDSLDVNTLFNIKLNGAAYTPSGDISLAYSVALEDGDESGNDATFEISNAGLLTTTGNITNQITGKVTVTLKKGETVLGTLVFDVTANNKKTSNDFIDPKGGVIFDYEGENENENWSITFPESLIAEDGVVNEANTATAEYSADFKQKIVGDVTLEFELKNYTSQGESPKFMVSFGGTHNQLYFVYKKDVGFRIESVIPRVNTSFGYWEDDGWLTSDWLSGYDPAVGGKFKVEIKDGLYTVYHMFGNETEYVPFIVGENGNFGSHTMAMNYDSYTTQKTMRMATKNAAVTVSNISVTSGTVSKFYHSTSLVSQTSDTLTIKAHKDGWSNESSGNGWKDRNSAHYTGAFTSSQTMSFDLKFDTAMSDSKFAFNIGGAGVFIDNKISNAETPNKICLTKGDFSQSEAFDVNNVDGLIHITAVRNGSDVTVTMTIGETSKSITCTSTTDNSYLYFWFFNGNESEQNATATVSNFSITNNN